MVTRRAFLKNGTVALVSMGFTPAFIARAAQAAQARQKILVATTKLSQFVTARYATKDAMQAVWEMVFGWLQPGAKAPRLEWTPTVRPTYTRSEPLPPDAARQAILRGIDWQIKSCWTRILSPI